MQDPAWVHDELHRLEAGDNEMVGQGEAIDDEDLLINDAPAAAPKRAAEAEDDEE